MQPAQPVSQHVDEAGVVRDAVAGTMRRVRLARGMSLRELANQTGLSTALLSQLERGVANPTVAALVRVADALQLTFAELTRATLTRPEIVRAVPDLAASRDASARMLFSMMERRRFDLSEGTLPPNTRGVASDHGRGSIEYGYVVSGALSLTMGDETHHLSAGDSVRFAAEVPHCYATADAGAVLLTVVAYTDE